MKYTRYYIYCHYYNYVLKCKKEKCIWKIFVKYTQIRLSNTNTNTNISSCGFSNTNTNTNTDICVFKYKYKYKYVFDPSPVMCSALVDNNLFRNVMTFRDKWHVDTQISLSTRAIASTQITFVYDNTYRHVMTFRAKRHVDTENPLSTKALFMLCHVSWQICSGWCQ